MEIAKTELAAIETTVENAAKCDFRELDDLQLALVGGGCAEVNFG
jgi:hypothetical protein